MNKKEPMHTLTKLIATIATVILCAIAFIGLCASRRSIADDEHGPDRDAAEPLRA
jgi:hypothetical protein